MANRELLESHPDANNRITYINDASKHAPVKKHTALEAIFEEIKNN